MLADFLLGQVLVQMRNTGIADLKRVFNIVGGIWQITILCLRDGVSKALGSDIHHASNRPSAGNLVCLHRGIIWVRFYKKSRSEFLGLVINPVVSVRIVPVLVGFNDCGAGGAACGELPAACVEKRKRLIAVAKASNFLKDEGDSAGLVLGGNLHREDTMV